MPRPNKSSRGKSTERPEKAAPKQISSEPLTDPLNAFPADPPRQNLALLIVSAVLFAVWFCYLAYISLQG